MVTNAIEAGIPDCCAVDLNISNTQFLSYTNPEGETLTRSQCSVTVGAIQMTAEATEAMVSGETYYSIRVNGESKPHIDSAEATEACQHYQGQLEIGKGLMR